MGISLETSRRICSNNDEINETAEYSQLVQSASSLGTYVRVNQRTNEFAKFKFSKISENFYAINKSHVNNRIIRTRCTMSYSAYQDIQLKPRTDARNCHLNYTDSWNIIVAVTKQSSLDFQISPTFLRNTKCELPRPRVIYRPPKNPRVVVRICENRQLKNFAQTVW